MFNFHAERARALLENAELLYDHDAVQASVTRIANDLNQRFGQSDSPEFPLVLAVMGGAVVFVGNLLPKLTFPLEFDYIHATRYGDDDHGGKVVWKVIPRGNVEGRTVIVLDDILDEGETLAHVKQRLLEMGASEVVIGVFAEKVRGKAKPIHPDYVGLSIPNKFVVGFGMDAYGYWRNLPGVWAIKNEILIDPLPDVIDSVNIR